MKADYSHGHGRAVVMNVRPRLEFTTMITQKKAAGGTNSEQPNSKNVACRKYSTPCDSVKHQDVYRPNIFEKAVQEAAGQEREILIQAGRMNPSSLDGRGHPCPLCGGEDRFRFNDKNGSCFCNQCFKTSKADVVSSLAWVLNIKRNEAAQMILEHLGVEFEEHKQRKPKSWKAYVDIQKMVPGHDIILGVWAEGKDVTVDAMKAAGVAMVNHGRDRLCVGFPIFGHGRKVLGYSLYNTAPNSMLDRWKGNDDQGNSKGYDRLKTKASTGSTKGMLGQVDMIANAETVYLCEGGTDMVAAIADGLVAISPSNGSAMKIPDWCVEELAGKTVIIMPDRDQPGQKAGVAWAQQLAAVTKQVKVLEFPFPLAENHGKDYRDFRSQHPGKLATLVENTEFYTPKLNADGTVTIEEVDEDDLQAYKSIGLVVISPLNANGAIVYSKYNKVTGEIPNIERLGIASMVAICGRGCLTFIKEPGEESTTKISIQRLRVLLADEISKIRRGKALGNGVWSGDGDSVLVVNGAQVTQFSPDGASKQVNDVAFGEFRFVPTEDEIVPQQDLIDCWRMSEDSRWRTDVFAELMEYLDNWAWEQTRAPELAAGLVVSTMCQSLLPWRPTVSIIGSSNSGKTCLMMFLSGLTGAALKISNSTAAGILRHVEERRQSLWILYDEWDKSKYQDQVLEMIRRGTRSELMSLKSNSSHGSAKAESVRGIFWLFGITDSIEEEADWNRTIGLRLGRPSEEKKRMFHELGIQASLDSGEYSRKLGVKLLAASIRSVPQAVSIFQQIRGTSIHGADARQIENLAIPAAFQAAIEGAGEERGRQLLSVFSETARSAADETQSDEERLLSRILSADATVELDGKPVKRAVSHLLCCCPESHVRHVKEARSALERCGLKIHEHDQQKWLAISQKAGDALLGGMSGRSIADNLRRFKGVRTSVKVMMNSARSRCTLLPLAELESIVPEATSTEPW